MNALKDLPGTAPRYCEVPGCIEIAAHTMKKLSHGKVFVPMCEAHAARAVQLYRWEYNDKQVVQ